MSYVIHYTKKLLERIKPPTIAASGALGTPLFGNWYATALFWKPQVALLVNEKTLLSVLMSLALATDLATRFLEHLAGVLVAHGIPQRLIDHESAYMSPCRRTV